MKLETIVVPLDGSIVAESALPHALDLAGPDTTIVLVRAVEAPVFGTGDALLAQVRVVREAETYLDMVRDRILAEGAAKVATSVWYGGSASAITEAAEAANADLLVMTTHGRTGVGRFILGSVTEAVLRRSPVPVLVVRDGLPSRVPRVVAEMQEEAARV